MYVSLANRAKKCHRSNLDYNYNGQVLHNEKVTFKDLLYHDCFILLLFLLHFFSFC